MKYVIIVLGDDSMKQIKMMYLKNCPHCKHAFDMVEKLKEKHPEYQKIQIECIEEEDEEEKIVGYDYYYVPTYFVDDIKMHEGIPTIESVEAILQEALK